jgi:hypothetical protein
VNTCKLVPCGPGHGFTPQPPRATERKERSAWQGSALTVLCCVLLGLQNITHRAKGKLLFLWFTKNSILFRACKQCRNLLYCIPCTGTGTGRNSIFLTHYCRLARENDNELADAVRSEPPPGIGQLVHEPRTFPHPLLTVRWRGAPSKTQRRLLASLVCVCVCVCEFLGPRPQPTYHRLES